MWAKTTDALSMKKNGWKNMLKATCIVLDQTKTWTVTLKYNVSEYLGFFLSEMFSFGEEVKMEECSFSGKSCYLSE